MNKSPYQIGKSIRILFIVSIFSLQSCDFETEVSIPKEIRITVIDHKNNQQEDGPYEKICTQDSPVWKWIAKEIPKLKNGWRSYYATLPGAGIIVDLGNSRRLQILDHGVFYISQKSVLSHDFQNEKFRELLTLIIETRNK
ncbi:hypothetical protein [Leptospira alstonii]|uniref:Lipoprotein n=2 Tax=Leptospira alstonii TaxID=28452 RepID=T0G6S1_9LEPT|nr:hypothetical protein [Leptospira alstonii]EMJ91650.1 putative lipoprotein [Leptospira alstonii serovar Sichuan str. 79601]EQA81912.1 putative lipoprotein [Leptospira alstonii serovar Pingchang str. 80-412]